MTASERRLPAALQPRYLAMQALRDILRRTRTLDACLHTLRHHPALAPRDQHFAEHLLRATLKHRPRYDRMLQACLHKPLRTLPEHARLLAYLATTQLHQMQVPSYAAIHSTVELAKHIKLHRLSGVLNAVLKRVASLDPATYPFTCDDVPAWCATRLMQDYGKTRAAQLIDASLSDITYLDITLKQPQTKHVWQQQLHARHIAGDSLRLPAHDTIANLDGFVEGAWWVQDIATCLPLFLMRPMLDGARVLDVCAAPGGKAMQAASYGAQVTARDRASGRLKRLRENLQRTGLSAHVMQTDLTRHTLPSHQADIVILDAPCSATGTLRRHPDIFYQRTEKDINELTAIQHHMLRLAMKDVAPEGYLLYLVCSLFTAEGSDQVASFLKEYPTWQRQPLADMAATPEIPATHFTAQGDYLALPDLWIEHGGMDGLYACLLKRCQ